MKLKGGRSSKKTKMGKIKLPMDVRDKSHIPAFEEMLKGGPMMLVLVYADWCGHCTKYKDNVWNPLKDVKGRSMNMASVHYDQLENTSLKNSKIEGYPSLLVSGPDKTPATFKNSDGTATNAMPKSNDFTTMKNLVTSPVVDEKDVELPKLSSSSSLNTKEEEPTNMSDTLETAVTTKPLNSSVNSSVNSSTSKNLNNPPDSEELPPLTNTNTTLKNSMNTNTNKKGKNTNSAVTNSAEPPPMPSDNQTPPTIDEDVVSLTNNSKLSNSSTPSNTLVASNSSPPPVAMIGGRLYRMISYKKKKSKSKRTRKHRK